MGPEALTIADTDALLYLPHKSRRALTRAVSIPALSEGWRESFQALLEQRDAPSTPAPAWAGFVPLSVTAIHRESAAIVSFTLTPPDGASAPTGIGAGQYLTLRLRPDGPHGDAVVRSYSLSTVAADQGLRISVKREPDGVGSGYLQTQIQVGDTIEAAAPRGDFTLRSGTRPVALISAGVGATPVLAMLHGWRRPTTAARSGGSTARAIRPSTPLPPRSNSCWSNYPTLIGSSPTASQAPARFPAAALTSPDGSRWRRSRPRASRSTPTTTSAGLTGS